MLVHLIWIIGIILTVSFSFFRLRKKIFSVWLGIFLTIPGLFLIGYGKSYLHQTAGLLMVSFGVLLLIIGLLLLIKTVTIPSGIIGLILIATGITFGAITFSFSQVPSAALSCGSNKDGQLGNGKYPGCSIYEFQTMPDFGNVYEKAACGNTHTLLIDKNCKVWSFGSNYHGELGKGSSGNSFLPVKVHNLTNIQQVAGGNEFSLALNKNGEVWSWGYNKYGQLGDGTNVNSWEPVKITLSDITAIAASARSFHALALDKNGEVWSWGYNSYGQLGDGTKINRNTPVRVNGLPLIAAISCGAGASYALDFEGNIWSFGWNNLGQLGNGTTDNSYVPIKSLAKDMIALTGGTYHCLTLDKQNNVWAFGDNSEGQLGNGSFQYSTIPVKAVNLPEIQEIRAGNIHSMAVDKRGRLFIWGSNDFGQLGLPIQSTVKNSYPSFVPGMVNVYSVAGGGAQTIVLRGQPEIPWPLIIFIVVCFLAAGIFLWFL